jgi:hypothetical protein
MKRIPLSVLIAVWLASGAQALAQGQARHVVVPEPEALGVDPVSAATFADLVRGELARQPGFTVVPRSQTPQQPCGDAACAVTASEHAGTHSAVILHLSQLGERVIVRVEHVDRSGQVYYSDRITGNTVEDLEPLSLRVARAVATGKPLADSATVTTVTANEAKDPVRKSALAMSGIRLGQALPVASSFGGSGSMTDFGLFAMFELLEFAAMIDLDFRWTTESNAPVEAFSFGLDLGGRYFLDPDANHGWFLGGGVGWRAIKVDRPDGRDSASGMGAYAEGGLMMFRTTDFHIIPSLRYDLNFFSLKDLAKESRTHSVMLGVAFSFKPPRGRWWF